MVGETKPADQLPALTGEDLTQISERANALLTDPNLKNPEILTEIAQIAAMGSGQENLDPSYSKTILELLAQDGLDRSLNPVAPPSIEATVPTLLTPERISAMTMDELRALPQDTVKASTELREATIQRYNNLKNISEPEPIPQLDPQIIEALSQDVKAIDYHSLSSMLTPEQVSLMDINQLKKLKEISLLREEYIPVISRENLIALAKANMIVLPQDLFEQLGEAELRLLPPFQFLERTYSSQDKLVTALRALGSRGGKIISDTTKSQIQLLPGEAIVDMPTKVIYAIADCLTGEQITVIINKPRGLPGFLGGRTQAIPEAQSIEILEAYRASHKLALPAKLHSSLFNALLKVATPELLTRFAPSLGLISLSFPQLSSLWTDAAIQRLDLSKLKDENGEWNRLEVGYISSFIILSGGTLNFTQEQIAQLPPELQQRLSQ